MAEKVDPRVQHIRRVRERLITDLRTIFTNMRSAVAEFTNEVQFVHPLPPVPRGSMPVGLPPPVTPNAAQIRWLTLHLNQLLEREAGRYHVFPKWTQYFANADGFDLREGWLLLKRITRVMREEVDAFVHCIAPHWEQVAGIGHYMDRVEATTIPLFEELVKAWGERTELIVLSHFRDCVCADTCGLVPGRIFGDGGKPDPNILPTL